MDMEDWTGRTVKIKPEWMEPGERDVPYIVIEDLGDRIKVQMFPGYTRKGPMAFEPINTWSKDWCYLYGGAVKYELAEE